MSASNATGTSSTARDHCCDLFPTRWISPFGTCQTTPSTSRRRVVRRLSALDRSAGDTGVDHVTDAELVLEEHEHAREEVADDALRAEAERDAEHARAGEQRREVDAELARGRSARRSTRSRWRRRCAAPRRSSPPAASAERSGSRSVSSNDSPVLRRRLVSRSRVDSLFSGWTVRLIMRREMRTTRYVTTRMSTIRSGVEKSSAISAARVLSVTSKTVEHSQDRLLRRAARSVSSLTCCDGTLSAATDDGAKAREAAPSIDASRYPGAPVDGTFRPAPAPAPAAGRRRCAG